MALRVRVMMERLGDKDAEAIQQEIERFDAANSRPMRASFNFDWSDALFGGSRRKQRRGRRRGPLVLRTTQHQLQKNSVCGGAEARGCRARMSAVDARTRHV